MNSGSSSAICCLIRGRGKFRKKYHVFAPSPNMMRKKGGCPPFLQKRLSAAYSCFCHLSPALVVGIFCNVSNWCVCTPIKYRTRHQHAHYRRHHESAPMVARKKGGCPPFLRKRLFAACSSCSCGLTRRGACLPLISCACRRCNRRRW